MRRLATSFWFAIAALQLPSCQFPDYQVQLEGQGGEDGGAPAGSSGTSPTGGKDGVSGSGGMSGNGGTSAPPLCEEGLSCQPGAPSGWLGPVAFWQGESGDDLPDCPPGYSAPTDLHASPVAEPAECECSCAPGIQKCGTGKDVKLYSNLDCNDECAAAGAQACTAVSCSGSGTEVSLYAPMTEPAGQCAATVTPKLLPVAWEQDVRFCELDAEVDACGPEQSCFPTPGKPFTSQLCVYQVVLAGQRAPSCPEEYPSGPELFYADFDDERACGKCVCEGLTGGRCTGEVLYGKTMDCSQASRYVIDATSSCARIAKPSYWEVHYTLTPGSCGVATPPEPMGDVVPSGNYHAVCCREP